MSIIVYTKNFKKIELTKYDLNKINYLNVQSNFSIPKLNKLYNDYIKFNILYEQGGFLIDGKVEIYKNLNNLFEHDLFIGFCDNKNISTNIMWSKYPKNPNIKKILSKIEEDKYDNITDVFSEVFGQDLRNNYNKLVNINDEVFIYPYDYFYPIDYNKCGKNITENLKTIYKHKRITPIREALKITLLKLFGLTGYIYIIGLLKTFKSKIGHKKYLLQQKYSNKIFKNIEYSQNIEKSFKILENYRNSQYVIIHNPKWLGVTSATKELFTNLVPMQEIYNEIDAKKIAQKIVELNIEQVIFSAFCFGWEHLAKELKNLSKNIKIKVFWHGSHSQVIDEINWKTNTTVILLHKQEIIDVFATCKESILNFYKSQGYNTSFIMNTVRLPENLNLNTSTKNETDKVKIGMYAAGLDWRKNMYTQLAAISLITNSVADVIPISYETKVFAKKNNQIIQGLDKSIKREELLKRIAQNDINIYVTFSECAPMLPIESMEVGVVCLTGNNHHYFKNTELEKYLVVNREDDVVEIANKIKYALENKEKIMSLYKEWKIKNDILSKESVQNFLNM